MKLKRLTSLLLSCVISLPVPALAKVKTESIAFFYAPHIPVEILSQYQRVILEADNVKTVELEQLKASQTELLAYVSIGEVSPTRRWYNDIDKSWILGKNNIWDSEVMDLANTQWHDFLINQLISPLYEKGYQGIFLDTLDSFNLVAKDEASKQQQIEGLVQLLTRAKEKHPELRLFANRGFEVMPKIGHLFDAVVAESLFASWDNVKKRYHAVNESDTTWLLGQLNKLKKEFDLDIIIIDYVAPVNQEKAKVVAKKIQQQGFVPWVTTPALNGLGVGAIDTQLNQYLVPFDSRHHGNYPLKSAILKQLAESLEKKGFKPYWSDIQTGFFAYPMQNRFKGIINVLPVEEYPDYRQWLVEQKQQGITVKAYDPSADTKAKE